MNQKIDDIIQEINRKWGQQAIRKAGQLAPTVLYTRTGFAALDAILPGIPKGHVSELAGRPSSGQSTLVHHIVAQAQASGENVVYIQMDNALDMNYAMSCGVHIDRMLKVETDNPVLALDVLREVVNSGVVGVIVLNLSSLNQRHVDLQRVLLDIRRSKCALVLLLPSYARSNVASLRLIVQRHKWLRESERIVGCLSYVTIEKNRFGRTGGQSLLLMPLVQEAWR